MVVRAWVISAGQFISLMRSMGSTHLVFILIFLAIVYLLATFTLGQPKSEGFSVKADAQKVSHDFGDEACDALQPGADHVNATTRAIADSYLRTGRFKKWKPNDQSLANDGLYCYSDEKPLCDEPMPSPVVRSFVSSSNAANTTLSRPNKCVFVVDPNRVNPESLDSFWSTLKQGTCVEQNKLIIEQNQELTNKKKSLLSKIGDERIKINRQVQQIAEMDAKVADLNAEFQSSSQLVLNVTQILSLMVGEKQALEGTVATCKDKVKALETSLQTCSSNLSTTQSNYFTASNKLKDLQTNMADLRFKMNVAKADLSKAQGDFDVATADFNLYNGSNIYVIGLNDECDRNLRAWTQSNDVCSGNLNVVASNLVTMDGVLGRCKNDVQVILGNLSNCQSNTLRVTASNAILSNVLIPDCREKYLACTQDVSRLDESIVILKDRYAYTKSNYRDSNCKPWVDRIDKLTNWSNWLVEHCVHTESSNDTIYQELSNMLRDSSANISSNVKTCQIEVETTRKEIEDIGLDKSVDAKYTSNVPTGPYLNSVVYGDDDFRTYHPRSCINVVAQNSYLTANCVDSSTGLWKSSTLDITSCSSNSITNQYGILTCGGQNSGKSYSDPTSNIKTTTGSATATIGSTQGGVLSSPQYTPYQLVTGKLQP